MQMQQSRPEMPASSPDPQRPPSPARSLESVSYPTPARVFNDGPFRFSEGTVEFLMAFSLGYMTVRLPDVLSQPVHTFTAQTATGPVVHTQPTSQFHYTMYNYLAGQLSTTPSTWEELANIIRTAARQHSASFGAHCVVELDSLLHMVRTDLAELQTMADGISPGQQLDARLVAAALHKFREASPLAFPRAIDAELSAIRTELSRKQQSPAHHEHRQGGRGRGSGEPHYAYDGGGRGKGGKARVHSLKDTTVIEKFHPLNIYIRRSVRTVYGPPEFRCFKCGSTQHKYDECLADNDVVSKWVDDAEPAP